MLHRVFLLGLISVINAFALGLAQAQPLAPTATRLEKPRGDSDMRLRTHLLGEWIEVLDEPSLTATEFKDDGTFVSTTWDGPARTKKLLTFTGNWTVADGFIVYETKTCSDPNIDISQSIIRDKMTSVTPNNIKYQSSDGARLVLVRGGPNGTRLADDYKAVVALKSRDVLALQRCLDAGASVDARDDETEKTLLMIAIEIRLLEATKLLLERKAKVEAKTRTFGKTALFFAAYAGDHNAIDLLIKHGANKDAVDDSGETALRDAILGGYPKAMGALLEAGCDINHKNKHGRSMLDFAQKYGNEHIKAVVKANLMGTSR